MRTLLGVSELIALSLATSGFISVASIAEAEEDLLKTVPGLEEEGVAAQLNAKAFAYVDEHGTDEGMIVVPEPAEEEEEGSDSEAESEGTASAEDPVADVADAEPEAADSGEPTAAVDSAASAASDESGPAEAVEAALEDVEQADAADDGDDPAPSEAVTDSPADENQS